MYRLSPQLLDERAESLLALVLERHLIRRGDLEPWRNARCARIAAADGSARD